MSFQSFSKTLEIIGILKEKVLDPKIDHPLENYYFELVDQIEKLPVDQFKSYYMRWIGYSHPDTNPKAA